MTRPFLRNNLIRRDLQEIHLAERVKRPKHLVSRLHLELTATDRGKLIVHQQTPELGGCLGGSADGGDEEIVKGLGESAVVGEVCEFGGGVQGVGWGVAGGGVGGEVGAVAEVGATGRGGDVAGTGEDGGFVYCVGGTLDAEIDDV